MSINTLAVEGVANNGAIPQPPSKGDVLAGLTKYVPTESITLYISIVSAQDGLKSIGLTPAFAYWFLVFLTPLLLSTLFLRQLAVAGQPWRIPLVKLPWWRTVASTIAFAVWALAVPGNPIISSSNPVQGGIAGLAALVVSMFLNIFEPFFERQG